MRRKFLSTPLIEDVPLEAQRNNPTLLYVKEKNINNQIILFYF